MDLNILKKIIAIFFALHLHAQDDGDVLHAYKYGYDPEYRLNYFNKMTLKVDINSDIDNFFVPALTKDIERRFSLNPNQLLNMRISFDYKFLGLEYSFTPNFLPGNNDDSQKGTTKVSSFKIGFSYSDQFRQELIYRNITGFYLDDLALASLENSNYILFPNLEIQTFGGKTFFIANKNFSHRAVVNQLERQIKSTGSFIPSISYFYNRLKTNESLTDELNLTKINSIDIFFQFGYLHNFVINKKWVATLGLIPGVGINESSLFYENNNFVNSKDQSTNFNVNLDINSGVSYNNKNTFAGLKFNFKNYDYSNSYNAEIINSNTFFEIYFGYRFNEEKKIKKAFEYMERKFGL